MTPQQQAALSQVRTPLVTKWMLSELISARVGVSRAGRPQVSVGVAPVINGKPDRDLSLTYYLGLPEDGDSPKDLKGIRGKAYGFLRATDPEFQHYPEKVGDNMFQKADGTILDYPAYNQECNAVNVDVFARLARFKEEGDKAAVYLKGKRVFMKPQKPGEDGGQFIDSLRSELPDGEVYITEGFVDEAIQSAAMTAALATAVGGEAVAQ